MAVLDWLLDSDPAIRWQVLRDLVHVPAEVVAAERARITTEGWSARLLALQGEDGQWAGGACFPARSVQDSGQDSGANHSSKNQGQPWISTLPTLQLLHDFGIDPSSSRIRLAVTAGQRSLLLGARRRAVLQWRGGAVHQWQNCYIGRLL